MKISGYSYNVANNHVSSGDKSNTGTGLKDYNYECLFETMSGRELADAYKNGKIDRSTFDTFVERSVSLTGHKLMSFEEFRSIFESFFVVEFDATPFTGRTTNAILGSNSLAIQNGSTIDLENGYSIVFNGRNIQFRHNGKHLFERDMNSPPHLGQLDVARGLAGFLNQLRHYADGNIPSPHFLSTTDDMRNTKRYLQMLGIDTSREFKVNGVRFRFVEDSAGGVGYVRRA